LLRLIRLFRLADHAEPSAVPLPYFGVFMKSCLLEQIKVVEAALEQLADRVNALDKAVGPSAANANKELATFAVKITKLLTQSDWGTYRPSPK
jgi:hypothetical protein